MNTNVGNNLPDIIRQISDKKQNQPQPQQEAKAKKPVVNHDVIKFPNNAKISDEIANAEQLAKNNIYLDRGSIVNILV